MRYAFTFDASACTGCKACQVACKDKNQLPEGLLWRRVYEVSGGGWQQQGAAWTNTVFAYNVSMACNHCADPACVAACPAGAYVVREDGIVWSDAAKCIGCEYCAWACPYSAPQYSPDLGRTTKCDFCSDLIDAGLAPACVSACPMRALEFIGTEGGAEVGHPERPVFSVPGFSGVPRNFRTLWTTPAAQHPFPMPATARTQPCVAVQPHRAMLTELPRAIANREEVHPRALAQRAAEFRELPLVAFTLLGQAAAGTACVSLFTGRSSLLLAAIGVLLAAAALMSLLHLGRPSSAWRAPANLKASRLSGEVGMLALFGAAWLMAFLAPAGGRMTMAVCAAGFVFSMGRVYLIDAVPPWNTWRTSAAFAASALLLGLLTVTAVATLSGLETPALVWPVAWALLAFELWLTCSTNTGAEARWRLRCAVILTAMMATAILSLTTSPARFAVIALIVLAGFAQECLGRTSFYSELRHKTM